MSGNEIKDNSNFEFIKEQVIEKKRRKLRKRLMPFLMTIFLAILFGLIAAFTFVVAEPKLNKFLNREEETKEPVSFPTLTPEAEVTSIPVEDIEGQGNTEGDEGNEGETSENVTEAEPTPTPVIVEQTIDATLKDYIAIYDEMRQLTYETNKSLVEVASTFTVTDWLFNTSAEETVFTTVLIVASNSAEYLIMVSLDRIQDAKSIRIRFSDSAYVDAVPLDYESEINIALLSVTIADIPQIYRAALQVADLGESNTISVGTPVMALGNPNGYIDSMEVGIVTSRGSYANITDNRMELFNTDMEFNNKSDGVIVNMKGRIIGWITRTVKEKNNSDVSTVMGISKLIPLIYQMGYQQPRVYFGIIVDDMTTDVKNAHKITSGIYVSEVQADSPAFNAGIKNGDIILDIDDQPILNTNYFYNIISSYKPDNEVVVKLQRTTGATQKEVFVTVTLTEKMK